MHAKLILRWWSYKVIRLKAHSFNQTVTTFAVSSALFNFIITYYWNMSPHWVFKIVGLQSRKHCNVEKSYLVLFLPRNHPRDIIFPFLGHCDLVVVCSINYIIPTYLPTYCYVIVFIVSYRGITNSRFSLTQSKPYIF